MTLDHLLQNILAVKGIDNCHNFIWNRTRAIRKDFDRQELYNQVSVDCFEKIARYHILAMHQLRELSHYSIQQEMEQLRNTLKSLNMFYKYCRASGIRCENEAEFRAYYMLAFIEDLEINFKAQKIPEDIANHHLVQQAWQLLSSVAVSAHGNMLGSAVHFFGQVEKASVLVACILEDKFALVRKRALCALAKAHDKRRREYNIEDLVETLGFNDVEEARKFMEMLGMQSRPLVLDPHMCENWRPTKEYRVRNRRIDGKFKKPIVNYIYEGSGPEEEDFAEIKRRQDAAREAAAMEQRRFQALLKEKEEQEAKTREEKRIKEEKRRKEEEISKKVSETIYQDLISTTIHTKINNYLIIQREYQAACHNIKNAVLENLITGVCKSVVTNQIQQQIITKVSLQIYQEAFASIVRGIVLQEHGNKLNQQRIWRRMSHKWMEVSDIKRKRRKTEENFKKAVENVGMERSIIEIVDSWDNLAITVPLGWRVALCMHQAMRSKIECKISPEFILPSGEEEHADATVFQLKKYKNEHIKIYAGNEFSRFQTIIRKWNIESNIPILLIYCWEASLQVMNALVNEFEAVKNSKIWHWSGEIWGDLQQLIDKSEIRHKPSEEMKETAIVNYEKKEKPQYIRPQVEIIDEHRVDNLFVQIEEE